MHCLLEPIRGLCHRPSSHWKCVICRLLLSPAHRRLLLLPRCNQSCTSLFQLTVLHLMSQGFLLQHWKRIPLEFSWIDFMNWKRAISTCDEKYPNCWTSTYSHHLHYHHNRPRPFIFLKIGFREVYCSNPLRRRTCFLLRGPLSKLSCHIYWRVLKRNGEMRGLF